MTEHRCEWCGDPADRYWTEDTGQRVYECAKCWGDEPFRPGIYTGFVNEKEREDETIQVLALH